MFGVRIQGNQLSSKAAWFNSNCKPKAKLFDPQNPDKIYTVNMSTFARKPTTAMVRDLYLPITEQT